MAARGQPFFTENFTTNLDSIELFLDREGRPAFRRLLSVYLTMYCLSLPAFLDLAGPS